MVPRTENANPQIVKMLRKLTHNIKLSPIHFIRGTLGQTEKRISFDVMRFS